MGQLRTRRARPRLLPHLITALLLLLLLLLSLRSLTALVGQAVQRRERGDLEQASLATGVPHLLLVWAVTAERPYKFLGFVCFLANLYALLWKVHTNSFKLQKEKSSHRPPINPGSLISCLPGIEVLTTLKMTDKLPKNPGMVPQTQEIPVEHSGVGNFVLLSLF